MQRRRISIVHPLKPSEEQHSLKDSMNKYKLSYYQSIDLQALKQNSNSKTNKNIHKNHRKICSKSHPMHRNHHTYPYIFYHQLPMEIQI